MKSSSLLSRKRGHPRTFETGIRSGKVVDAVTNKPIMGAVVAYTWDARVFGLESRN